jgi:transcriptional regulator with XRE-family HTH domain
MTKAKSAKLPNWVRNLRALMDKKGFNPRSLSLKAGLNATAVRDMLEGRSRFPRYDTVMALALALDTTPALLMSEEGVASEVTENFADLELLTEVIARLQEVTSDMEGKRLSPRDFAAMASTIYQSIQGGEAGKKKISAQIHDLLDYEMLRQKRAGRRG